MLDKDVQINKKKVKIILLLIICCLLVSILFISCQTTPKKEEIVPIKYETVVFPEPEVKLSAGDIIEIRFFLHTRT